MTDRLTPFGNGRARILTGALAEAQLERLGLPGGIVRDAVEHGAGAARSVSTSEYPKNHAGVRMWAETGAAIVSQAYEFGWERERCGGVEPLVNRMLGVAILVTAGDGCTGEDRYNPHARYERPDLVRGIVRGGLNTLLSPAREDDWEIYFLLHHLDHQRDLERGYVAAELSAPLDITDDGRVTEWHTRIMIPAGTPDDGEPARVTAPSPVTEPPSPAVTIRRRAS